MPKITTLEQAYVEQLRDIYNAENQLVKALPKMAKAATNEELKAGFEQHLEQTKEHVARLEEIFEELDEKPPIPRSRTPFSSPPLSASSTMRSPRTEQ
jgi:ferritin-like metal-binding protein YciE